MSLEQKIEDLLQEAKDIKSEIHEIRVNKNLNEITFFLYIIMISTIVIIYAL